jgi:6-pyruvoyltetrahydropterin/6-carboxytetrahydropterin synthase
MTYSAMIAVKHNIEVAHRLFLTPGKCENIHGHSMWVTLFLDGEIDSDGLLESIEFGTLKQEFRGYLDESFDHHLLLNAEDPWCKTELPGLSPFFGDPTTENIARCIFDWANDKEMPVHHVDVWETAVNMASYGSPYGQGK